MKRLPMFLSPVAKDYLWGGSRLNDDFNFNIPVMPFAEAWVCSTHPDGTSCLSTGESLRDVLEKYPDLLGSHVLQITGGKQELPILIKLIDAEKDLSVQVHPDDEYALRVERSLGKTEMWYVLEARPGAELVYGFNQNVTVDMIRDSVSCGTVEKLLNHVEVHKNDLFYIEAGTVHAIGAGCLIAEIQESSNLTYRLYDYNRIGKDGKRRTLHIDRALEVANLKSSAMPRQPMRVLKYTNGCASELLTRCKYFQVERLLLNTEVCHELVEFRTHSNSFHVLLCIYGCGSISAEGFMQNFFKGDCIFVPADSIPLKLHGKAQFLNVSC